MSHQSESKPPLEPLSGEFVLRNIVRVGDALRAELANYRSVLGVTAPRAALTHIHRGYVYAELEPDNEAYRLSNITQLDRSDVVNAATLIAWDQCPVAARRSLEQLVTLIAGIEPMPLRDLVNELLLEPHIVSALLESPSTRGAAGANRCHLTRIVESVCSAERLRTLFPSDDLLSLPAVACLLYELGCLPMREASRFGATQRLIPVIIGKHLERLRAKCRVSALMVVHVLDQVLSLDKRSPVSVAAMIVALSNGAEI